MSKKFFKIFLIVIFVLLIGSYLFLSSLVSKAVSTIGPEITGTPVELGGFSFSPFTGRCKISDFVLGNPQGYKTDSAMRFESIHVDVELSSLFSDRIIIDEILIRGPQITFEGSLKGSNLSRIQKNVESFSSSDNAQKNQNEKPSDPDKDEGKKIQINKILMEDGAINLSVSLLQGNAATIPLPKVEKEGIGADEEGANLGQVVGEFYGFLFGLVTDLVKGSANILKDASGAIGEGLKNTGQGIGEGLKGIFKK